MNAGENRNDYKCTCASNKKIEKFYISLANAFPGPWTMMVEPFYAYIAIIAMINIIIETNSA